MVAVAQQSQGMTTDETRIVSVDFSDLLDSGETLTGAPTVQHGTGITVSSETINSAEVTVNDEAVAIGKAVQFVIVASASGRYLLEVLCSTSAGQTLEGRCTLDVSASRF